MLRKRKSCVLPYVRDAVYQAANNNCLTRTGRHDTARNDSDAVLMEAEISGTEVREPPVQIGVFRELNVQCALASLHVPACFLAPTNRDMTRSCFYGQCFTSERLEQKRQDQL